MKLKSTGPILLFLGIALSVFPLFAAEKTEGRFVALPKMAIAMHGEPKYNPGFTSFDYVNPVAPKGGMLRLGTTGTFNSTNPFIIRGQPALGLSLGFLSLVFESLMARSWDEPFSLYGLIAETVEVPDDRSSITFNLRREALWQDGQPITADDVLFSFTTLRDQGRPNHRLYYKKVALAEKIGERSVRFVFKRNADGAIDREMPLIMGLMPILPQHDWHGRDFNQTTLRAVVGCGPYKIGKVEPGRSITYERDPSYWAQNLPTQRGQYNFGTIRIDYYRDDSVSLQAFKAGQYDLRREADPKKWATAYDFPAVKEGRIKMDRFEHKRTEPINGFILNTRRSLLADLSLRRALALAFDSGWINHNLFHGQYRRSLSFFPNSELATDYRVPPSGAEKEVLERFRSKLPPTIFTDPVEVPSTEGSEESLRAHLLKASEILKDAGYVLKEGKLYTSSGALVSFEILLSDPAEEKVALQWARGLLALGIQARARTVDSAQYQARLASFDYDVTSGKWFNSLSPGNEQKLFWGSAMADQKGSRNYPGIRNEVIDSLASEVSSVRTREALIATTRALDRLLLAGNYIIPFFHTGADPIVFWQQIDHPTVIPLYGPILETWWQKR